jgi:hypothetical protein
MSRPILDEHELTRAASEKHRPRDFFHPFGCQPRRIFRPQT